MTYFQFYNIPVSFQIDADALRATFYANSKKYHPDFYTLSSEEEQERALQLSTLNNEAYKTLSDADKRMQYILELKGVLEEEGKNEIPQAFLMEMMDINEVLMELEFDFDADKLNVVKTELNEMENRLLQDIQPVLDGYNDKSVGAEELKKIKEYYFKRRYLLRIGSNLEKFAS